MGGAAHSGRRESEGEGEVEIVEDMSVSTLDLPQRMRTVAMTNYGQMSHG